jgi:ferritin-like metal-binding protein YciE
LLSGSDVIREHTEDALAAEEAFEECLRAFATQGDDQEVQRAFAEQAGKTRLQIDRLRALVGEARPVPAWKSPLRAFLNVAATVVRPGHTPEERVVQNLIAAYCVTAGECAMYEALASVARYAGDLATEAIAREIQAEKQQAGQRLFRFLPTRSKIAYNVLTAHEVDPSVETKVGIS